VDEQGGELIGLVYRRGAAPLHESCDFLSRRLNKSQGAWEKQLPEM
jgi:hypothetical protein